MNNQVQRVIVAAIGIPLALGLVWLGDLPLALFVAALAALGTRELFTLAEQTGMRPLRWLGITLAAAAPLGAWWVTRLPSDVLGGGDALVGLTAGASLSLIGLLVPIAVLTAVLIQRGTSERPISAAAVTLLGVVYCGVLPSALVVIRNIGGLDSRWTGVALVVYPLAITWLCDTFAMYGGKLIGGPKLWPAVSPGKTRSGAVAGVVGGVATAMVYVPLALVRVGKPIGLVQAAVIGVVLSVVAQVGDLVESLFKREAGVKDSGGLIPGHGGVLDRLDSLYFVLPVSLVLYWMLGVL